MRSWLISFLLLALALVLCVSEKQHATAALAAQRNMNYIHEYHHVWQLVADNYIDSNKLTNWKKYEHIFDKRLSSDVQLKEAVESMLHSLDDPYTWLREAEDDGLHNETPHEEQDTGVN